MYITRTCEKWIRKVAESFPCIVLYGPRQVGKTTTVEHLYGEKYRKITLDDSDELALAKENPKLFLEVNDWPLIIDEIQKAPELLPEIKRMIDEQRAVWMKNNETRELMYILTGSNQYELQEGVSESLAGRCGVIDMSSFSMCEKYGGTGEVFLPQIEDLLKREKEAKIKYRTQQELFEDIFTGGMPDVCTGVADRTVYYKAYVDTYIEKDVRKLIAATSELQFRNFISVVAMRTAQELHYDELSDSTGIDARTCKKWLSILRTSGIIYLLEPYMSNISKRIIKAPKLYFMDTGLCAYLCKWPDAEMLRKSAMNGAFFETFVVSELIKNLYANGKEPRDILYYYRDTNKKEIDIIYSDREDIYPIEIKMNPKPSKPTKNFDVLNKYKKNIQKGLVIDTSDKIRPVNEAAWHFPAYLLGV